VIVFNYQILNNDRNVFYTRCKNSNTVEPCQQNGIGQQITAHPDGSLKTSTPQIISEYGINPYLTWQPLNR
jgi:hypothetical protein